MKKAFCFIVLLVGLVTTCKENPINRFPKKIGNSEEYIYLYFPDNLMNQKRLFEESQIPRKLEGLSKCKIKINETNILNDDYYQQDKKIDLIFSEMAMTKKYAVLSLIEPINTDLLDNLKNSDPYFLKSSLIFFKNQRVTIPIASIPYYIVTKDQSIMNKNLSFLDIFNNPDTKGRWIIPGDIKFMFYFLDLYFKSKLQNRMDSTYQVEENLMGEIQTILKNIKSNNPSFYTKLSDLESLSKKIKNPIYLVHQANMNKLNNELNDLNIFAPTNGILSDNINVHVSSKSENINCSYKVIDSLLNPEIQYEIAKTWQSIPVNKMACKMNSPVSEQICNKYGIEILDRILLWEEPQSECGKNRVCISYLRWESLFQTQLLR
jgi:spermidine/putrescine-binding protein